MLERILLLATLLSSVNCGSNILPLFDPTKTVWDCTEIPSDQTCLITFVVYPLTTMTYYNFTSDLQPLKGYRVAFDSSGNLGSLNSEEIIPDNPPLTTFVQADGCFRTIITVNGQMPGPTIIAHGNQILNITVINELRDVDAGISIHWHGMDQIDTPEADGVAYITQLPIIPNQNYTYSFRANAGGTYWYHSHAGAQRSDGLYGALIVQDEIPGYQHCLDLPTEHTLLLMDWQQESSDDLFRSFNSNLGYWKESDGSYIEYQSTVTLDNVGVGPMPFWSGIINDKGRHYNESGQTNIRHDSLSYFNVTQGNCYRFRLIGSQALYGFKVSIQDHKMTVVATDGLPIVPIEDVDSVIVNPGERYDVILSATETSKNFWIWAETLEDENLNNQIYNSPISKHRAEAILHYNGADDNIDETTEIKTCTSTARCSIVNCPFTTTSSDSLNINCTNAGELEFSGTIADSIQSTPSTTLFYNFGFDGEADVGGSSIDGIDFQLPANPPLTENAAFNNSGNMCPHRGCDHKQETNCACTQVIDIGDLSRGSVVELVLTNMLVDPTILNGASHPVHVHGHDFYVIKQGYPEYYENGTFKIANDDIECINSANQACQANFITVTGSSNFNQTVHWKNNTGPDIQARNYARKDTVIVPFGGYTIIRFEVNNPGWWFIHCHIEIHQLNGMVAVIRELPDELPKSSTESPNTLPISPCSSSLQLGSPSLMMIAALITAIATTHTCM